MTPTKNPIAFLTFLPNVGDALFNLVDDGSALARQLDGLLLKGAYAAAEDVRSRLDRLTKDADTRARTEWSSEEIAQAKHEVNNY